MNLREAIKALYEGKKVALPEWKGWWYLGSDNMIWVHADVYGDVPTPMFVEYGARKDWIIVE